MSHDFRTVPRYFVMAALPASLGDAVANVVDLSVRGARLQVSQPFTIGATLQFALQANGGTIMVPATISWCRMAALSLNDDEADRYFCGVQFDQEQPMVKQIIDELLVADLAMRIEDSRTAERYTITAQITGSFGAHSPVRIIDLSIRGARIVTDRLVPPGTSGPLRFRIDRKHFDLNAEMVWCRPSDRRGGYECGLKFGGEEALLRQLIAQLCTRNQARVDLHSLRRKFDPMRETPSGLLALV
jgi:hypothetical protein